MQRYSLHVPAGAVAPAVRVDSQYPRCSDDEDDPLVFLEPTDAETAGTSEPTDSWADEVAQIQHRKHLAAKMGGEKKVARQHSEGRLTAREPNVSRASTHRSAQQTADRTAKNIRAELKGLMEDRDPGDSVVVALVGHGVVYAIVLGLQLGVLAAALFGVGLPRYYVLVTWATLVGLWNYLRRGVPTTWEVADGTR